MNNLGYLYKRGGNGILRDMAESLYWFKRGAEAGDIYAMDNLGACYRDGVGVPIDLEVREAVHESRSLHRWVCSFLPYQARRNQNNASTQFMIMSCKSMIYVLLQLLLENITMHMRVLLVSTASISFHFHPGCARVVRESRGGRQRRGDERAGGDAHARPRRSGGLRDGFRPLAERGVSKLLRTTTDVVAAASLNERIQLVYEMNGHICTCRSIDRLID